MRRRSGRELSEEERRAWAHLAASVTPMPGRKRPETPKATNRPAPPEPPPSPRLRQPRPAQPVTHYPAPVLAEGGGGLDKGWERKLSRGAVDPDFTLDLHGHTLDAAWRRLDAGMSQAIMQGARVLLVVAGKPRPADAADRGNRRGAIRAKLLDWIAAGPHASRIAAVRGAHPRHGGRGAVYLILRRAR